MSRTLLALVALLALPARAAESVNGGANLQRFTPAVDPLGAFSVGSGDILPEGGWALGLHLNYARNPLVLRTAGVRAGSTLSDVAAAQLHGAFHVLSFLELGFGLPVVAWQRGNDGALTDLPAQALGDLELQPRFRLLSQAKAGIGLSVTPGVTIPLGGGKALGGEKGVSFTPRASVSHAFGHAFLAADLWFQYRPTIEILPFTRMGHELGLRAAGGFDVAENTEILGEVDGALAFASLDKGGSGHPLEALAGVRHHLSESMAIEAGVGAGILSAPGTPDFRVVAGFTYGNKLRRTAAMCSRFDPDGTHAIAASGADADGDGIDDACDLCPGVAEVMNGIDDADGCPEPDADGDGLIDVQDECPAKAGVAPTGCPDTDGDGLLDRDDQCPNDAGARPTGCPDKDGDGILDKDDFCPDQAEDKDNFEDTDGCPDPDNDGDKVPDTVDQCPNVPEDRDGFEDADGCPDPDNDQDGIPDAKDKCPSDKETINGVDDDDGCPDKGKVLVIVRKEKIEILDKVFFATDKDIIEKRSYPLLDQVALTIKAHAEIKHLRVEGHTDDQGGHEHNVDLSQRRAEAVKTYLVSKGVEAARLEPKGFADDRPLVPNKNEKNRATNRRVEFNIVDDAPAAP